MDTQLALSAGNFFIGWVQSTANELNIGLDKRTDNGSKLYYNIGSGWNQSIIFGSLMLHPVFGACEKLYIGVETNNSSVNTSLQVYPNPSSAWLHINTTEPYLAAIEIYDLTGKLVSSIKQNTNSPIDISKLDEGIYFCV
ncbi:MAG: T9SS type A sorting domain-containing protein [Bacteroidetes bacterium]|nr:T9SS type A sorting domain-containing protein [Bacteroidota bacterium]